MPYWIRLNKTDTTEQVANKMIASLRKQGIGYDQMITIFRMADEMLRELKAKEISLKKGSYTEVEK